MPGGRSVNQDFKTRRLRAVAEDVRSGATSLACKALEDLIDYTDAVKVEEVTELINELRDLASQMQLARPAQAALQNALERWMEALASVSPLELPQARRKTAAMADRLIEELRLAQSGTIEAAFSLISEGTRIMVLGMSAQVLGVFNACHQSGRKVEAIICEARPGMEGRKMARALNKMAISAQFISEAQIPALMSEADLVITGACQVCHDGSVVAKVGSRLLALAAQDAAVPFWVLAESFKHSVCAPDAVEMEEMPVDELYLDPLAGIQVRNIYTDLVPARLVSRWVNEQGAQTDFRSLSLEPQLPLL